MSTEQTLADRMYHHSKRWTWDADLMTCRQCKRSLHVSRQNEALVHAAGCGNVIQHPWLIFAFVGECAAVSRVEAVDIAELLALLVNAKKETGSVQAAVEAVRVRLIQAIKGEQP